MSESSTTARPKAMLSYAEAVEYSGMSERWLRLAVRAGLLTPAKFGSRRLFRRSALDALIELAEREGIDSLSGATPAQVKSVEPVRPHRKPRGTPPQVAA